MGEVLFNTSGSTGDAKTIIRTEESLTADAANLVKSFPEIWNPENTKRFAFVQPSKWLISSALTKEKQFLIMLFILTEYCLDIL